MWNFECDTEFGMLSIQGDDQKLCSISLKDPEESILAGAAVDLRTIPEWASQAIGAILRYLQEGQGDLSSIPLDWARLTPFERTTLKEAQKIPSGQTITYGELARRIHRPEAARAVGGALSRNPFLLAAPCHRIIGSDGRMRGFSAEGGIDLKARLLQLEMKSAGQT